MKIILNKTRKNTHKGNDATILFALHMLYSKLQKMQIKNEIADEGVAAWWDSNNNDIYGSADDDGVYIIGYHPEQDEFLAPSIVPTRQVGTTTFVVPAHLLGGSAHLWIFMADRKKKRVSKSSYLGLIQLI